MQTFLCITVITFLMLLVASFYQFRYNLKRYKDGDLRPYKAWFILWAAIFGTSWLGIYTYKVVIIMLFLFKLVHG